MTPRTYLFVPGDRPDRFDKAWDSAADAVILDLEDAVAPDDKAGARAAVANWLDPDRPVWVRCNTIGSPWHADDLELIGRPGLAGLMLPKAETVPPALAARLRAAGAGLMPLIETAHGIAAAQALAREDTVVRLAFGSLDFQVDLGIEDDGDALLPFRAQLVLASRLADKPPPVDGVTPAIDDTQRLRDDTARARRIGMQARLCIHPRQILTIHEVLAPDAEAIAWAMRVLAAIEASGGAAVSVDGRMVDRPVALRAETIVHAVRAGNRLRS